EGLGRCDGGGELDRTRRLGVARFDRALPSLPSAARRPTCAKTRASMRHRFRAFDARTQFGMSGNPADAISIHLPFLVKTGRRAYRRISGCCRWASVTLSNRE